MLRSDRSAWISNSYANSSDDRQQASVAKSANQLLRYRRPDIRKENADMTFSDCGKQIGEEWWAMPDDIKAPYIAKAQANSSQYKIDMANYSPSQKMMEKQAKDPNAPKRPVSAYFEYVRQQLW